MTPARIPPGQGVTQGWLVLASHHGWKSRNGVCTVELLESESLGFRELRGYHNAADLLREERLV